MAPSATGTDLFVFALTAAVVTFYAKAPKASASDAKCDASELKNSAFVFIKPHANTPATQVLVKDKLEAAGITILSESDISGSVIDEKKLIDQHYYAIASKATILPAKDIPVPADKFEAEFGETWETALKEDRACNAMDACKRFGCTANELDAAWAKSEKVVKFGGGFYCGTVSMNDQKLYVFNAFFMNMRSKFTGDVSIHTYEVEWSAEKLGWEKFRGELLGPTDPSEGPEGSIRKTILDQYKELGLTSVPNKGDNGVHASASPFEGLAEKLNWLGKSLETDSFGKALLDSGISKSTIEEWSVDPRVTQPDGKPGSIFDSLEDTDVSVCLKKMIELNGLQGGDVI